MSIGAIIVAGGKGLRAGGETPKQLQMLGHSRVFEWAVAAFEAHASISKIVVVVPHGEISNYKAILSETIDVVEGGTTRTASVRNGIDALAMTPEDTVLIHDAARPGLDAEIIDSLIAALQTADAAAPALAVVDALKRQSGTTLKSEDRSNLYRIQTPQAFRIGDISKALSDTSVSYVDDLEAVEALGLKVVLVAGQERLAKITYPGDLERMEQMIAPRAAMPRIGNGFDVHAFADGDGVTLCGVLIPHTKKLSGHSDADVAWHALTDAILGAAALGDIGDHFPPSDAQWRGVDSAIFLRHAIKITRDAGYNLASCDLTVICEAPKVGPHRLKMRERTAEITGLPLDAISVKATTTEKLGFTGRREGIAAMASAVLSPI